jgi:hypothetical protein
MCNFAENDGLDFLEAQREGSRPEVLAVCIAKVKVPS